jgi:hypothetical protein
MIALAIVSAFILVALVVIGFIIGLIIGIAVFFLIMGGLNAFLTDLIWGISIKSNLTSLLVHGFVLFIALLIVAIPSLIISVSIAVPSLAISITVFLIYCFIDGFVAKNVAAYWQEDYGEDVFSKPPTTGTMMDVDVKELYKEMLLDYVTRYGSITGKSILNAHIKDYLKKGLSEDEAIRKLAKAERYIE